MPWLSDCCWNCGSLVTCCCSWVAGCCLNACSSIANWYSSCFSEDQASASGPQRVKPVSPLLNASSSSSPDLKARLSASLPAAPRSVGINTPSNREACAFLDLKLEELTTKSLKTAYNKKALLLHPDKPGGSDEAFRQLSEFNARLKAALNGEDAFEVNDYEESAYFEKLREKLAEDKRKSAEYERKLTEDKRKSAEDERKWAEDERKWAEYQRKWAEDERQSAEQSRLFAERQRVSEERRRDLEEKLAQIWQNNEESSEQFDQPSEMLDDPDEEAGRQSVP